MDITKIETMAQTVAAEYETSQQAHAKADLAEGELLRDFVDVIKPALRALSSQIVKHSYETGGRNGCNPVSRVEYHDERGVCLTDDFERFKDESGNRGSYGGSRLYLLTDGNFAVVTREGLFSHWQGEASEWTSTLEIIAADRAAEHYEVEGVLSTISEKLTQAVGSREKATARAVERAEKAAAIARLVRR